VAANRDIIAKAGEEPDLQVMGATIAMALWSPKGEVYIAGVGDCRAYFSQGGKIEQLTIEHSLAQALVEAKTITPAEAKNHRFRNVLWKYLGSKEVGDGPDVMLMSLRPSERILLCTKGLYGAIPNEGILTILHEQDDVQKCAEVLCQGAVNANSRSNVSCIVLEQRKEGR
jgi:protein phosphatase